MKRLIFPGPICNRMSLQTPVLLEEYKPTLETPSRSSIGNGPVKTKRKTNMIE